MNREQRRKLAKEQNRPNSKKNFADGGTVKMSIAKIQDNEDLKPCDTEVLDLMAKRMDWAEQNLVKNDYSSSHPASMMIFTIHIRIQCFISQIREKQI